MDKGRQHLLGSLLVCALMLSLGHVAACQSKADDAEPAKESTHKDTSVAPEPDLEPWEPPLPVEPPAPGPPGDVTLPLEPGLRANVASVHASATVVVAAYRVETDGEELCTVTKLPRCQRWYVVAGTRGDTETAPVTTLLAESDTPSGIVVEGIVEFGDGFAVLWREGRYAEDPVRLMFQQLDGVGQVIGDPVSVLPSVTTEFRGADFVGGADGVIICWSGNDARQTRAIDRLRHRVWCRQMTAVGTLGDPVVYGANTEAAGYEPSVTWREDWGLLTFVRDGARVAVRLGANLQPTGAMFELGDATARPALLASGHGGHVIAFQDADNRLRVVRVNPDGVHHALVLDEAFHHLLPSGLAVTPEGFLLGAVNKETVIRQLDPLVTAVAPTNLDTPRKVRVTNYGLVDITDAYDKGELSWRRFDAESEQPDGTAPEDVSAPDASTSDATD